MVNSGGCLNRILAKFYLSELVRYPTSPYKPNKQQMKPTCQLLAIHAIHQHGVIHRDLKPENILFNDDGHLVVADFRRGARLRRRPAQGRLHRGRVPALGGGAAARRGRVPAAHAEL